MDGYKELPHRFTGKTFCDICGKVNRNPIHVVPVVTAAEKKPEPEKTQQHHLTWKQRLARFKAKNITER